ncbi:hypothetical protein [Glycomyces buryatensis]|uniref:Uncharacterized protein n=1 Tax=Glycomyces buryatensis TaxID=2570927 RepID=A0A4S8QDD1_9ACTN|nr:hypothetical protein [Glycomyces buryatensis]THV42378.1 hypothetical protein FAB82_06915 [Glycomyces buryatensis]
MPDNYTAAVETYLRERAATAAEIEAAHDAYRTETADLAGTVAASRARRDEANRAAVEASTLVAETDKTVAVLWRALGEFVGHRRTGPTPHAAHSGRIPTAAGIRARLKRADRLLSLARRGELPIEAPRHTEITAAAIGAAVGALAVAAAAWILSTAADGSGGVVRGAFAAATLFAGIGTGPIVLGVWLSWQYRVRPRPGQMLACVGAAIVCTCALAGAFLRNM